MTHAEFKILESLEELCQVDLVRAKGKVTMYFLTCVSTGLESRPEALAVHPFEELLSSHIVCNQSGNRCRICSTQIRPSSSSRSFDIRDGAERFVRTPQEREAHHQRRKGIASPTRDCVVEAVLKNFLSKGAVGTRTYLWDHSIFELQPPLP